MPGSRQRDNYVCEFYPLVVRCSTSTPNMNRLRRIEGMERLHTSIIALDESDTDIDVENNSEDSNQSWMSFVPSETPLNITDIEVDNSGDEIDIVDIGPEFERINYSPVRYGQYDSDIDVVNYSDGPHTSTPTPGYISLAQFLSSRPPTRRRRRLYRALSNSSTYGNYGSSSSSSTSAQSVVDLISPEPRPSTSTGTATVASSNQPPGDGRERESTTPSVLIDIIDLSNTPNTAENHHNNNNNNNNNHHNNSPHLLGDCPVCLEHLVRTDIMASICGHIFCRKCIINVVKINRRCPQCRKYIDFTHIHPLYFN